MEERYIQMIKQMDALFEGEYDTIANLSNASAILFHGIDNVNWAGFYLYKKDELVLGPFQGKVACMHIAMNKGVCGTAAFTREVQCIENVHEFPGHIACDCASNSEIVIPIIINNTLYGVLDIDSFEFNNFNEFDVKYLTLFVDTLIKHIH